MARMEYFDIYGSEYMRSVVLVCSSVCVCLEFECSGKCIGIWYLYQNT